MKIETAPNLEAPSKWVNVISHLWREHPLKSSAVDLESSIARLKIIPNANYITRWGNYPLIELSVNSSDSVPNKAAIFHELTHIVDRHDKSFTGGKLPLELTNLIDNLTHNVNSSVRTAFRVMWDTYIDGRLSRRGIFVYTFEYRLDQLLSSRKGRIRIENEEIQALRGIWDNEPQTFDELVKIANLFPVRRPPNLRTSSSESL